MAFSDNLKMAMKNNNISQYRMSQETGISQSLISDWIKGKRKPGADHLRTICLYLGESADRLLDININDTGGGKMSKFLKMHIAFQNGICYNGREAERMRTIHTERQMKSPRVPVGGLSIPCFGAEGLNSAG